MTAQMEAEALNGMIPIVLTANPRFSEELARTLGLVSVLQFAPGGSTFRLLSDALRAQADYSYQSEGAAYDEAPLAALVLHLLALEGGQK